MYNGKKILAFIPARGGSKGIKNKNIVSLYGKPLVAYSIEAALQSKYVDMVFVSTDSEEIARVAKEFGAEVPFLRPAELAQDTSKTIDALVHGLRILNKEHIFDSFILLQPTSPLREKDDIDKAIELFYETDRQGVISVTEASENPVLIRTITEDGKLQGLLSGRGDLRRQDMPKYYVLNGCIYIGKAEETNENTDLAAYPIPYIMQKERSIDIDAMCDIEDAEKYLREKNKK